MLVKVFVRDFYLFFSFRNDSACLHCLKLWFIINVLKKNTSATLKAHQCCSIGLNCFADSLQLLYQLNKHVIYVWNLIRLRLSQYWVEINEFVCFESILLFFFLVKNCMRLIHLYQKNRPHLSVKVSGDLEQRFGVCEKRSGSETLDLERWRFI